MMALQKKSKAFTLRQRNKVILKMLFEHKTSFVFFFPVIDHFNNLLITEDQVRYYIVIRFYLWKVLKPNRSRGEGFSSYQFSIVNKSVLDLWSVSSMTMIQAGCYQQIFLFKF